MQWKNPDGSLTGGVVIEDGAGNKLGTVANPLNVTGVGGGGSGSNASVGSTGAAVPASATVIGFQNASGNLATPTPSAGLPVADSGAPIAGVSMPAGGLGLTGWLSAIWSKLSGTLAVSWGGGSQIATSTIKTQGVTISDPSTGAGALVQAFHNADNQALAGTVYGVMTGGVDQLVNGSGNLDRKRGVSGDAMAVTGLAAEVPMVFNGATYDRWYGDKTYGAWVNVKALPAINVALGTTGGWTPKAIPSLGGSLVLLKSGAGQLGNILAYNPNSSVVYLQIFNQSSTSSVTLGTTAPDYVVPIPSGLNGGFSQPLPGIEFSTGIVIVATTTANGSTAPGTGLVVSYGVN